MIQKLLLVFWILSGATSQTCPVPPTSPDCLTIITWDQLANAIASHSDIVFCPFSITKSSSSPLLLEKTVKLICQEEGGCIIDHSPTSSGRRFFKIRGRNAQVTISGFVFKNGGDRSFPNTLSSALHIGYLAGDGAQQLFCNCDFIG